MPEIQLSCSASKRRSLFLGDKILFHRPYMARLYKKVGGDGTMATLARKHKYLVFCVSRFKKSRQIWRFHWMSKSQKCFSFKGSHLIPWPGALPLDPTGGSAPRPPLEARAPRSPWFAPPLPNTFRGLCVCLSVCKRRTMPKNCLKKQIELPDSYLVVPIWSSDSIFLQPGVLTATQMLEFRIAAKPLQLAAWLFLKVYRNLRTRYPTYC